MKRIISVLSAFAMLASIHSMAGAAELLAVKAVEADKNGTIEITADIPMTYTFYNIPGQPRAVVDIADADPENVEPLIIINKGVVSSISVDKAQISGMVVSRVVFNLVSESGISVSSSSDRKKLTVTFSDRSAPATVAAKPKPLKLDLPEPAKFTTESRKTEAASEAVENKVDIKLAEPAKAAEQPRPAPQTAKTEDPLGLDEPAEAPTAKTPPSATTPAVEQPVPPPAALTQKAEPAAPMAAATTPLQISRIVTGDNHIEIRANGVMGKYKVLKLTQPERIVIDIAGSISAMGSKSIPINKFGISRARIGAYPGYTRIVLDSAKTALPKHSIASEKDSIRINFNQ